MENKKKSGSKDGKNQQDQDNSKKKNIYPETPEPPQRKYPGEAPDSGSK